MSENTFKGELLKQNGTSAVDEEVSLLRGIIATDQRRVRRLMYWTIGVWAVWILMISLAVAAPILFLHASHAGPTTQPVATVPAAHDAPRGALATSAAFFITLIIGSLFFGLPVAGVVLAIMLIVNRRTANLNQVRASLAAIDAQLRMLGTAGVKSDRPPVM